MADSRNDYYNHRAPHRDLNLAISRVASTQASGFTRALVTRSLTTAASIPFFRTVMNGFLDWARAGLNQPGAVDQEGLAWETRLGGARNSSIFQAGRGWAARGLASAKVQVVEIDSAGLQTPVAHPVLDLLERPNEHCTWTQLMGAFAYHWLGGNSKAGTVYIRKHRDMSRPGNFPDELWIEPICKPISKPGPNGLLDEFISGYQVQRNDGRWYDVAPEDMIVIRDGWDPITREGENWRQACSAELFADKRIGHHTAQIVLNGLLNKLLVGVGSGKNTPSDAQLQKFREEIDSEIRGNRSNVVATSGNVKGVPLSMDYGAEQLNLLRQPGEERFAAGMGVSTISLGLGSGANMASFSNVYQLMKRDYRNWIVPVHQIIAAALTYDLLTDFGPLKQGDKRLAMSFNYDMVPEMQQDRGADSIWVTRLFLANVITHAQACEQMGYKSALPKIPQAKWATTSVLHQDMYAYQLGIAATSLDTGQGNGRGPMDPSGDPASAGSGEPKLPVN